jgi:hypothetical protein
MQVFDIFGELFFECERDDLVNFRAGLGGNVRLGQQHIRTGNQHAETSAGCKRDGLDQRAALRLHHHAAAGVGHHP